MKKHLQKIRQHKHKSLLLRDGQFQLLACSCLIWFIAVDDQHKEPMIYVYKDHLDGKLATLAEIKTSKNLNQDDENRQTTNVVETFPF